MERVRFIKSLIGSFLFLLFSVLFAVMIIALFLNRYSNNSLNANKYYDISESITGNIYKIGDVKNQVDALALKYSDGLVCAQINYRFSQETDNLAVFTYIKTDSSRNINISVIIALDLKKSKAVKVSYVEEKNNNEFPIIPVSDVYFEHDWLEIYKVFCQNGIEGKSIADCSYIGFYFSDSNTNIYYANTDETIFTYENSVTEKLLEDIVSSYSSSISIQSSGSKSLNNTHSI